MEILFQFWFNTSFIRGEEIQFRKEELGMSQKERNPFSKKPLFHFCYFLFLFILNPADKANKDKGNQLFPGNFKVTLVFEPMKLAPSPPTIVAPSPTSSHPGERGSTPSPSSSRAPSSIYLSFLFSS